MDRRQRQRARCLRAQDRSGQCHRCLLRLPQRRVGRGGSAKIESHGFQTRTATRGRHQCVAIAWLSGGAGRRLIVRKLSTRYFDAYSTGLLEDRARGRAAIKPFERVAHPKRYVRTAESQHMSFNLMRFVKKLSCILLLASNFAHGEASLPALTAEQWRQDLEFFANEITTKHRDPFHFISKAEFDQAVSNLRQRMPSMKDYEVVAGLQHLAALIGDGHTFLDTSGLYKRFPLEGFWFGNDLRVIRAAPEYREALGSRIVSIGSVAIGEVQKRIQQFVPQAENQWYVLNSSAKQLMSVEPLAALGVLPGLGSADFNFEDDSGRRFKLRIRPVPAGASESEEVAIKPVPLPFQHQADAFWFTYLADSKTVYVNFRSYRDLESQSERLWEYIGRHPVRRLIIDMRWNQGGNFTKGREYLIYKLIFRPALNRAGHLFVITGRGTFSAGMTNVTDFRRETEAILVGEPTSGRPKGYQEIHLFTFSLSLLRVFC